MQNEIEMEAKRNRRVRGFIWIVDFDLKCLDIRRYADTHSEACALVKNPSPDWTLFKLVQVNKNKATKTCIGCLKEFSLKSFHRKGIQSNRTRYGSRCVKCQSKFDKKYYGNARIWSKNNPEKIFAQQKIAYLVRHGKIKKPSHCQDCNKKSKIIHGHHSDYSKPYDVEWLCPYCHKKAHKELQTQLSILDKQ